MNIRAPRIGMQSTQQRHVVSIKEMDRNIIGSGVEKSVPYQVSEAFAIKAKEDGSVTAYDEGSGLMTVLYKSGKEDLFDLSTQMLKNSNGGFYTSKNLTPLVRLNEKFRQGDILAKDSSFFSGTSQGDISYDMGKMSHIALVSSDGTYEDSTMVTDDLAEAMSTKITMKKDIALNPGSTVSLIAKKGQRAVEIFSGALVSR